MSEAPAFVAPHSSGLHVLRRIGAVVLGAIVMLVLLVGAAIHTASSVLGSPTATSNEILAVVTQPAVAQSVANSALNDIAKNSSPAVAAQINLHRAAFSAAIVATIEDPMTQQEVRNLVAMAYASFDNGVPTRLNFRPLVEMFTSKLHAIDALVPATPPVSVKNYTVLLNKKGNQVNVANALNVWAWALSIVGSIAAIVLARFMVRRRVWRLVDVGATFAIPGLMVLLIGLRMANLASGSKWSSATERELTTATLNNLGKHVANNGWLLLGEGAVIVLVWMGLRQLNDRRKRTSALAAGYAASQITSNAPPVS